MCQLETLNSSLTLLSNVSADVRNGVSLILEVTIGNVGEARRRVSLVSGVGAGGKAARLTSLLHILLGFIITLLDLMGKVIRLGERLDEMLHVVALTTDETAEVKDNSASLITLSHDGHVSVLKLGKLLLVPLALTLKLLSNLLLKDKSLESVITLLLGSSEAHREASVVILLLINETSKTTVLPLVCVDLDLEILGLLGEGLSEGLELEELLLPALKLLNQVVVTLSNLVELRIHAALKVDKILPSLKSIARVLVPLTNDLIKMAHRNLGHERLLHRSTKDGLDTSVASKLLTDVVHNSHDGILVPPLRILDRLNLTAHNDDLARGNELAATISGSKMLRNSRRSDITVESLCKSCNKLVALAGGKSSRRAGGKNKVAIKINNQSIGRGSEERATLNGDTQNVRAGLLNQFLSVTSVHNWDIESAPLVNSNTVSHGLSSHGEHSRVVADEDDSACRRDGSFDNTDNVGNRETVEKRPHGKVLESGRRRWELVAESVVLHVDANKIVEARSREAQDTGNFLSVEQVGSLVPVNPHTSEIISKKIVQRVS